LILCGLDVNTIIARHKKKNEIEEIGEEQMEELNNKINQSLTTSEILRECFSDWNA
jgi:hypothetical protein